MTPPALSAYFDDVYPPRSSLTGRACSRSGEDERLRVVRGWLPSTRGLRILDAGCGDGVFLRSILAGRPARIACEDISGRAVRAAARELDGCADVVTSELRDAIDESAGGFDVVLTIGMLDYQRDWRAALAKLLRRSSGVVIASVPRREHCRNWLRYVWFSLLGIDFHAAPRRQVARGATSLGRTFALERTSYDWLLRIAS